jgi:hypothetical protein
MDNVFYIGVAICAVCIVASRIISERNYRKLGDDQKDAVMDAMSSMRLVNLVPIVLVAGLFLGVMLFKPASTLLPTAVVFGILAAYQIVRHVLVARTYRKLKVPSWYARAALLSSWIYNVGLLVIIASSLLPELEKWIEGKMQ